MPEITIDDSTSFDAAPAGSVKGLIPRDFKAFPQGCYAAAPVFDMPLIPRSEWSDRIKEGNATESFLSHIRLRGNNGQIIPSLDQNLGDGVHWGYCWAHSSTHAVMILRAAMNLPYVPLSAFAVAATIKNGRNDGGWGAQSMEFIQDRGVPSQQFWPQKNVDLSHGTPECWANAAQHKITEGWADLNAAVYDRDLTFDQVMTCLLSRIPVVLDYNWWGHSVMGLDPVEVKPNLSLTDPNRWAVKILNSWSDSWSDRGMGNIAGRRAIPDGAVAPRTVSASAA